MIHSKMTLDSCNQEGGRLILSADLLALVWNLHFSNLALLTWISVPLIGFGVSCDDVLCQMYNAFTAFRR